MASIISQSFLRSIPKYSPLMKIIRFMSTDHHRPLMLMNLPHVAAPNLGLMMKNFFSRIIINGYFDSTFAIKPFCQGARQALTVVSHLVGNGQFDDLPKFVTQEVIHEVKQNYDQLSFKQRQQIPVEDNEIIFSHPYSINMMMNEQTSK
ncbi:hypothetical protein I4U23_024498 [Adineta vaga]|nr:hypothetical protein I4U23_024498 [Adineta vaga]